MTYTTELNPIRKYIKLLSLLLVLPTVLFSVMNIPFGHLFTSVAYIMVFVCFLKFASVPDKPLPSLVQKGAIVFPVKS